MSIQFDATTDFITLFDQVDVNTAAAANTLTEMTLAITVTPTAAIVDDRGIITQWGSSTASRAFVLRTKGTTGSPVTSGLGFVVTGDGANTTTWYGRLTDDLTLIQNGVTTRIAVRWRASGPDLDIWTDGTNRADSSWFAGTCNDLVNSTAGIRIGQRQDTGAGLVSDMSDIGIWLRYLSDDEMYALTTGYSPGFFPYGRISWIDGHSTNQLYDRHKPSTGFSASGTAQGTTEHRVIMPSSSRTIFVPTAVGGGATIPIFDHHYRMLRAA